MAQENTHREHSIPARPNTHQAIHFLRWSCQQKHLDTLALLAPKTQPTPDSRVRQEKMGGKEGKGGKGEKK